MADNKQLLSDFVATAYKDGDVNSAISKFPELKSYDKKLLSDFVATAYNDGDVSSAWNKFPEFHVNTSIVPTPEEFQQKNERDQQQFAQRFPTLDPRLENNKPTLQEHKLTQEDTNKMRNWAQKTQTQLENYTSQVEKQKPEVQNPFTKEYTQKKTQEARDEQSRQDIISRDVNNLENLQNLTDEEINNYSNNIFAPQQEAIDKYKTEKTSWDEAYRKSYGGYYTSGFSSTEAERLAKEELKRQGLNEPTVPDMLNTNSKQAYAKIELERQRRAGLALNELKQANRKTEQYFDSEKNNPENRFRIINKGGMDLNTIKWLEKDTEKTLKAPSTYTNSNGIVNFGKGISDTGTDIDTWTLGITEIARNLNIKNILEKSGKGQPLNPTEESVLANYFMNISAHDLRQSDVTTGYKTGQALAQSIPFMVEFGLTDGTGTAVSAAIKKSVGKVLGKYSENIVGRFLSKAAGNIAETTMRTALMPTTYAQMTETALQNRTQGKDYSGTDLLSDVGNAAVENLTEVAGGRLIDKGLDYIPGIKNINRLWEKNPIARAVAQNSPISEMGEEYLGGAINYLRSYMPYYDESQKEQLQGDIKQLFTPEGFKILAGSILPVSGMFGLYTGNNYRKINRNYQQNKTELQNFLKQNGETDESTNYIISSFENTAAAGYNENMPNLLESVAQNYQDKNPNATEDQVTKEMQKWGSALTRYLQSLNGYQTLIADTGKAMADYQEKINEATDNATAFVNAITHAESGNVIEAKLYGVDEPINITKGNIVTKDDGTLDTDNSDKIFFYKTPDGQLHIGNTDFIENINNVMPATQAIEESLKPLQQELQNENAPQYAVGSKVVITDNTDPVNPQNVIAQITGRNNDGTYRVQRDTGGGKIQQGIVEPREILPQFEGVLDTENAAVDYTDPQSGQQQTGIIELDTADKQIMFANGYAIIKGKAIPFENIIGVNSEQTTDNRQQTTDNLQNNETNGLQATEAGNAPEELGKDRNRQSLQESTDLATPTATESQEPRAKSQDELIPTDEKGNLLFEQARPELTIQFLQDNFEKEEIVPTVEARINAINKEISRQEAFKPSGNIQKDALAKQAKKQALSALNEQLGYWGDIKERVTPRNYKPKNETVLQRNTRWGEPVSLRELIIRKFIGGLRLRWEDEVSGNGSIISRGLGAEYRYDNNERKSHFSFISGNGLTPEQLAHTLWEANAYEPGQFEDMPLYGMDTQEILSEVLDVMNSYRSIGEMIKAVDEIRDQYSADEQAYIDSLVNDAENRNNILKHEIDDSIFAQIVGVVDLTEEQQTELQNIQNNVTNKATTATVIGSDSENGSQQPGEAGAGEQPSVSGRTVDAGGNKSGDRGVETVDKSTAESIIVEAGKYPIGIEKDLNGEWVDNAWVGNSEYSLWRIPDSKTIYLYPNTGNSFYEVDVNGNVKEISENEFEKIYNEKIVKNEPIQAELDTQALDADIASQEHNINPTEKQKETGIYPKARVNLQGYNITLETLKGTERSGIDEGGQKWSVMMNNHYGELDGTTGYDGDAIDVFIGPNPKEGQIYVIDQTEPRAKSQEPRFDESKVMLGFDSAEEAKEAYLSNYEPGWDGFGAITPAGDNFKEWLYDGKKQRKPYAEYVDTPEAVESQEPRAKSQEDIRFQVQKTLSETITVDGVERPTINSNGKPIHSTEELIRNFWRWFGDSKVVDENGRPLVCYHNSGRKFNVFDIEYSRTSADIQAFYFKGEKDPYKEYGENEYPVYLKIKNPADYKQAVSGFIPSSTDNAGIDQRKKLESEGFDGFIMSKEDSEMDYTEIGVFLPTQIKSATENDGTFDSENADIRFQIQQENANRIDEQYFKAIERGDMEEAQRIVDQQAANNGYISANDYRDAHRAPGAEVDKADFRNLDVLREIVEEDGWDTNLYALANGISKQPDDYFSPQGARWYGYDNAQGYQSASAIRSAMRDIQSQLSEFGEVKEMPLITVYRAVQKSLKEGSIRNGDWVTPSLLYAQNHGKHRLGYGEYRIIKEDIPADNLWWDGNDVNEWGVDDGNGYAYKDTKNNKKLTDVIVRDDNGEIIPLSKRFNQRINDVRFQTASETSKKFDVSRTAEEKYEAGKAIIEQLDAENGRETLVAKNNKDFAAMLPEEYEEYVMKRNIGGVFFKGGVIINAEKHNSAKSVVAAYEHEYAHKATREIYSSEQLAELWQNSSESDKKLLRSAYRDNPNWVKGDELLSLAVEDIIEKQGYYNYKNGNIDLSSYSETLQKSLKQTIDHANKKYLDNIQSRNAGGNSLSGNNAGERAGDLRESAEGRQTSTLGREDNGIAEQSQSDVSGAISGGSAGSLPATITVDGVERQTTNSNGKPIHSTEEGIRNFWRWFGDSKVVDENGRPLVVYHGTDEQFTEFNPNKDFNFFSAIFTSPFYDDALSYGPDVKELYVKLVNPAPINEIDKIINIDNLTQQERSSLLEQKGYDGFENYFEKAEYVVFSPTQIKSATGNDGTFDSENADIRYQIIGEKGAASLDAAQEATTRLDNLRVAKEMEEGFADKKDSRGGVYNSAEYKTAEKVRKLLKLRGIDKPFTVSSTNFGNSMYFTVLGENQSTPVLKVRISDHGVSNKERIFGEQHESSKSNPERIANDVERAMFPERYNQIKIGVKYYSKYNNQLVTTPVENGEAWIKETVEKSEPEINKLLESGDNVRVLSKEVIRESKSGNKVYKVEFERRHTIVEEPIYKYERKEIAPEFKQFTPQEIRLATGWEKGVDGLWRYEVADGKLREGWETGKSLKDVWDSEELYASYPALASVHIAYLEVDDSKALDGSSSARWINNEPTIAVTAPSEGELQSALIHEIQHQIQSIEGFGKGGNMDSIVSERKNEAAKQLGFKDEKAFDEHLGALLRESNALGRKWWSFSSIVRSEELQNEMWDLTKKYRNLLPGANSYSFSDRHKYYSRLSGEVESRNAQQRNTMNDEERRNTLLAETADVAPEDQIVLMDGMGVNKFAPKSTKGELPATIDVNGVERPTSNSNGKPIHSTEEGIRNFWRWFGDSKVVDENGRPLVVYHGSISDFNEFKLMDSDVFGTKFGHFFTPDKDIAKIFADRKENGVLYATYLKMEQPKKINGFFWDSYSRYKGADASLRKQSPKEYKGGVELPDFKKFREQLQSEGNDGVILNNISIETANKKRIVKTPQYIVFKPNQIKSATGNEGTFSPDDNDIRFQIKIPKGELKTGPEFYQQVQSIDELKGIGKPVHDKKGGEPISEYYKRVKAWSVANNPESWDEVDRQEVADFIAGKTPDSYEAKSQRAEAAATEAGATVVDEPKPVFQQDGHANESIGDFAKRVVAWREVRFINGIVRAEREAEARAAEERGDTPIDHEIARMQLDMELRTVYDSLGKLIGKESAKKLERFAGNKEMWADSLLPVKTFLEYLRKSGMKIPDIDNYYMQATALQGKNDTGFNNYVRKYQKPINKWIKATVKATGLSYRDIENYVFLKHGVERNEYFKKDGKHQKADYAGVYAIAVELYAKENGIPFDPKEKNEIGKVLREYAKVNDIILKESSEQGIYDELFQNKEDVVAQATVNKTLAYFDNIIKNYVAEFENESNGKGRSIDEFWQKLNAANDFSIDTMADGGIITREQAAEIKSRYRYFIPLRGHEVEAEKTYEYTPDAGVFFSNPAIKARGRMSRGESPFAYIAQMAQSSVVMTNKNNLNKTLLRLARRDKTGLLTTNKTWYIKTSTDAEGNDIWEEAEIEAKPFDELNRAEWEAWNERMKELEKDGRARQFTKGVDLDGLFIKKKQKKQHAITVIENGEEYQVYINANPRISRAINGLNKSEQNAFYNFLSKTKGMIGLNITSRNPAFMAANFTRDTLFAASTLPAKEGGVYAAKYIANIGIAAKELAQYQINPDTAPEYVREFFDNGGETGYSHLWELQDMQKEVDKAVATGMSASKAWDAITMPIDVINKIVENTTRMAVYKTSRESGRTIERSVSDAKEVSLNFNRSGSGGGIIVDFVRSAYLFVNAGVQALNNFTGIYKAHPWKMSAVVLGYAMSGLLMPLINSGAGDDDDEYWNLPEYERQNNLCIWTGSGFIKIPLPQELRVFYRMGDNIAAMIWNKEAVGKAMVNTIEGMLDLIPAEPSGAVTVSTVELVPDAFKPFAQVYWSNQTFTGAAIAKEKAFMKEGVPQWRQVRTNRANEPKAPSGIIWLSATLNAALGGDQYRSSGAFEKEVLNPDKLNHLARGYFGGIYTTAMQGLGTVSSRFYLGEKELNEKTTGSNLQHAYDKIDEAEKRVNQFNTIVKDLQEGKIDRLQFAKDTVGYNFGEARRIQKLGSRLRDINKMLKENQDLSDEEKNQLQEAQKTILRLIDN